LPGEGEPRSLISSLWAVAPLSREGVRVGEGTGVRVPAKPAPELRGDDSPRLAVAALGATSYRDLLDLQARWLVAGVPSLFVTADPDGLRVGPLTVPGASPCF